MEELQIINLENTEISAWDFEAIKAEVARWLSEYSGIAYTDEKSAKADKKKLNDLKKALEDRRKEFKKTCLAPYEEIEPKVKELVGMIDTQTANIDKVVKEYDERRTREKEEEIRKFYDKKALDLGNLAEPLYRRLFDQKWLLKGTSKPKYEEGVLTAITKAKEDLAAIKAMESPFVATLVDTYVATLSMEAVQEKNEELVQATSKAGLDAQAETRVEEPTFSNSQTDGKEGVTVRIFGTQGQLDQVFDFMKAIGVSYEIQ